MKMENLLQEMKYLSDLVETWFFFNYDPLKELTHNRKNYDQKLADVSA